MKKKILFTICLATLLAPAMQASQDQLAKSIQEAYLETTQTSQQLGATLISLNELAKQTKGDLRPAYEAFCTNVVKTEVAAAATRKRVDWMQGDAQKYFKDWQNTISGIANESLRKNAQKRLNTVKESFDKVQAALLQAGEKFKPFLSDLSDIQKALAADVTAGGVKAIRGTVRRANSELRSVDEAIRTALKDMGKMQKALSPEAQ